MAEIPISFNLTLPKPGSAGSAFASIYASDRAQEASLVRSALAYKQGMEGIKREYFSAMLMDQREKQKMFLGERNKEIDRMKGIHEFNLDQMNDHLKQAIQYSNDNNFDHWTEKIKSYVGSMDPYFQKAFRPWLNQNAMGSIEYKDYIFRKNNPYPETPETTFAEDPYTHGKQILKQNDWRQRRAAILSNQPYDSAKDSPSFIPMIDTHTGEPVYLMKDGKGNPIYRSAQEMQMNDIIKGSGGTDADLHSFIKSGGELRGPMYESIGPDGRVTRSQLVTRPLEEPKNRHGTNVLPPQGQASIGERPVVSPFEGYNAQTQKMLNDIQIHFGPVMQLSASQLGEYINPDISPQAMSVFVNIRRMLDKGMTFEQIGKTLAEQHAGNLNFRLLEKDQFDKFTWYNPLDILDPDHIRGLIDAKKKGRFKIGPKGTVLRDKYKGYEKPVGDYGISWDKFWEGSVYSPGPDFDIRVFPGDPIRLQRADGTTAIYFYDNSNGADMVRSWTGIKLGTLGEVQTRLLRGEYNIQE